MLQHFQWGRVQHRKRHTLSRTPKTSVIALSGITAITGQYVPLKQNAINTIERGARHQANVELQCRWRKRGQPGPCQR